jgi:hypothetical protein
VALRPVFVPTSSGGHLVSRVDVEFQWHPGLSVAQARKSIHSLHEAAQGVGLHPVLEISTRSPSKLGYALSAFHLMVRFGEGRRVSLECAYQASKVFSAGGPFLDLLEVTPSEAKRDPRLRESGTLRAFLFDGAQWPLDPPTAFYDWLYINAIRRSARASAEVQRYAGFTDIAFNPAKSLNCQAHSVALFVALLRRGWVDRVMSSPDEFRTTLRRAAPARAQQGTLPLFGE